MAPKYKLTYFNVTGLGEALRFLLSYGGLEFEDNRIARDNWPTVKEAIKPPLGQLPLLEVDGNVLFQSTAIARYLGSIIGIAGATPLENWKIDAVMDTLNDLRLKLYPWLLEKDESKKQTLAEALVKETFPFYFSKFEAWTEQNGGYLALEKVTWVDVVFAGYVDFLDDFCGKILNTPSVLTGYTHLKALNDKIRCNPNVQAYLEKRPNTNA